MLESCKHMKSSQRPGPICIVYDVSEREGGARLLSHYLSVSNDDDICDKTTISCCKQANASKTLNCVCTKCRTIAVYQAFNRFIFHWIFELENVICATLCVNPSTHSHISLIKFSTVESLYQINKFSLVILIWLTLAEVHFNSFRLYDKRASGQLARWN